MAYFVDTAGEPLINMPLTGEDYSKETKWLPVVIVGAILLIVKPRVYMEESSGNKKQLMITFAVLLLIVVIAGGAVVASNKENGSKSSNDSTSQAAVSPNETYQDGTYTATGDYVSPGGDEQIAVTVTVKNNVITSTSATNKANDTEAEAHQQDFIDNYQQQVVGKKLSQVHLSRVSGSSLTSTGFNDAIQQIRDQAKF